MKSLRIAILSLGVLLLAASVTFASAGVEKVPKMYAHVVKTPDASVLPDITPGHGVLVFHCDSGLPASGAWNVGRMYGRDEATKPIYREPDVDRKWIWWHSMKANA